VVCWVTLLISILDVPHSILGQIIPVRLTLQYYELKKEGNKALSSLSVSGSKIGCLGYLFRTRSANLSVTTLGNTGTLCTVCVSSYDFMHCIWRPIRNSWCTTRKSSYKTMGRGRQGTSGFIPRVLQTSLLHNESLCSHIPAAQ
jgi:hypothetical protein